MIKIQRFVVVAVIAWTAATVAPAATVVPIDNQMVSGRPSVAIGTEGLPVLACRTLLGRLRIGKCRTWDCSDLRRVDLPRGYEASRHFSLVIAPNDFPAIAYQDCSSGSSMSCVVSRPISRTAKISGGLFGAGPLL